MPTPPKDFEWWLSRLCGCCEPPTCPEPACIVWEKQASACIGGFTPRSWYVDGDDPGHPSGGFDFYQEPPVEIPLYKTREEWDRVVNSFSWSAEYKKFQNPTIPDDADETLSRTYETDKNEKITVSTVFGRAPWEHDPTNIKYGRCAPSSAISAPSVVSGISVSKIGETEEFDGSGHSTGWRYRVRVAWTDNRPNHPTIVGAKIGTFAVVVNGAGLASVDGDSYEFDTRSTGCLQVQIQHIFGSFYFGGTGNGLISEPVMFRLLGHEETNDAECPAPTWTQCQSSQGPSQSSAPTGTFSTWSQTGTYGGEDQSASGNECDSFPAPSGSPFTWVTSGTLGSQVGADTISQSETSYSVSRAYHSEFTYSGSASPTVYSWQLNSAAWTNATTISEGYDLSDLRPAGMNDLFTDVIAKLADIEATELSPGSAPVTFMTQDKFMTPRFSSSTGQRMLAISERSFRWKVPDSFVGTYFRVEYDIMAIPDSWATWKAQYFEWANAKYAFLQNPGDFADPGDAPIAPAEAPEVIDSGTWEATSVPPFDPEGENPDRESPLILMQFSEYKDGWTIQPANVRFKCYRDPYGAPPQRATDYLTFPLPDLTPTISDPAKLQRWWGGGFV